MIFFRKKFEISRFMTFFPSILMCSSVIFLVGSNLGFGLKCSNVVIFFIKMFYQLCFICGEVGCNKYIDGIY